MKRPTHATARCARATWLVAERVGAALFMVALLGVPACARSAHDSAAPGATASRQPNIVLFYIDDLGWRDVGFMGSDFYETPNIDAMAAGGMVFINAYANAPNCAPSRASLMSGQYPPRHGIYTVAPSARGQSRNRRLLVEETATELALDTVTVAESLRAAGYATGHMGKWHLGGEGHLPTDQGFDVNIAGREYGSPPGYFWPYRRETRNGAVRELADLRDGGGDGEYLTDRLTDEALRFVEAHRERPFFLYLTHYAVHTPIEAKEAVAARYAAKEPGARHDNPRYAAMVESVDDSVGRVLTRLEELGLVDDTIVVFYSDNGGFGPATSMTPLRGSKGMLYEGGIRVPLVVRWPGRVASDVDNDTPVIGTDLYPTLLELGGAEPPPDQPLDGLSLATLLLEPHGAGEPAGQVSPEGMSASLDPHAVFDARALFWHFPAYLGADASVEGPWRTTPAGAVRHGDFKLIEFFEDGRRELYNLADDIGEQNDLAGQLPEVADDLYDLLERWRRSVGAAVPAARNPAYRGPGEPS